MAKRMAAASTKPENFESLIAEAAYYKAEQRGFAPGNEMGDWLDAEREIETVITKPEASRKKASKKSKKGTAKPKKATAKA